MDSHDTKPTLVFFQALHNENIPTFLLAHQREHVQCLSQFFDVVVIKENCDYKQVCETYRPDVTLFESGIPFPSSRRPQILNARACPHIPKIGFLHADGFCCGRTGFLSDMDHWGIDTFFTLSITAAEHTPAIAASLFMWPNFIDPDIHRDYGQWKNIPVLFTGNKSAMYPWRKQISRSISKCYPSLISPHFGYGPQKAASQMVVGENYARMLNASWFVPACGTVAKEIVRKHFEVPGCRACLVTEQSPGLEAAGFADMQNCVFADEHDILDKLAHLSKDTAALNAIITAGHDLVHSRHTIAHRNQLFQWLSLHKHLKEHQQIVQLGPFEPLRIVDRSLGLTNTHILSNGTHLRILRQADEQLSLGKYEEAERLYLRCATYIPWMPEPKLRLTICSLNRGNAPLALSRIVESLTFTLAEYKASDPDPVEWAYFVICLLCSGKLAEACRRSDEFIWLRHPELDRARWVTNLLNDSGYDKPRPPDSSAGSRPSIHQLPSRHFKEWIGHLCLMLTVCGQQGLAATLEACSCANSLRGKAGGGTDGVNAEVAREEKHGIRDGRRNNEQKVSTTTTAVRVFERRVVFLKMKLTVRQSVRNLLHRLESAYGYFLPYDVSEAKHDPCFKAIQEMTREEDIKTVLIVGAALSEGCTNAVLAGALESNKKPSVFCITGSRRRISSFKGAVFEKTGTNWYRPVTVTSKCYAEEVDRIITEIKKHNQISAFDVVLIDASELGSEMVVTEALKKEVGEARFVLLDDINTDYNHEMYRSIYNNPKYMVLESDAGLRDGYVIFVKEVLETMRPVVGYVELTD
jgi:hypothetical protein